MNNIKFFRRIWKENGKYWQKKLEEKEGIEVTINSTSLKDKLSSDNLIENGNGTFYECVITFLDDSSEFLYVEASSFDDAKEILEETRTELAEINSIKKTSILNVLRA